MQLFVKQEICIGCGACAALCPEVFRVQDNKSMVIGTCRCSPLECKGAIVSCRVGAIRLS
ncbi:MAG: ferredoxin [Thermodesulfobacteriota bacterium]